MYTIEADIRDGNIRPKNLRKDGITPCCLYGNSLDETILLQIPANEAQKLIREKDIGGRVSINCDDDQYYALIKDLDTNILDNSVTHIGFQHIQRGEKINGTARVLFENNNDAEFLVHQMVEEIPYQALAEDIVEEVIIDLDGIKEPTEYYIKDLSIADNDKVELMIDPEQIVLNIVPNVGMQLEEDEEEEDLAPVSISMGQGHGTTEEAASDNNEN